MGETGRLRGIDGLPLDFVHRHQRLSLDVGGFERIVLVGMIAPDGADAVKGGFLLDQFLHPLLFGEVVIPARPAVAYSAKALRKFLDQVHFPTPFKSILPSAGGVC